MGNKFICLEENIIRTAETSEPKSKKSKNKRKSVLPAVVVGAIVFVAVLFVCFAVKNGKVTKALCGSWCYDEYTVYEFYDGGKGCMCIEDTHYPFEFNVSGSKLKLDFETDTIRDCEYELLLVDDTLYLKGGKGTVGGEYELKKV